MYKGENQKLENQNDFEKFTLDDLYSLKMKVISKYFQVIKLQGQLNFKETTKNDIYPGQAACLWYIAKNPGISQKQLAEKITVAEPTTSLILKKMEKAGLIVRKPDLEDHRTLKIFLNAKGEKILNDLKRVIPKIVNKAFEGLSKEELNSFYSILEKLHNNILNYLKSEEDIS